MPRARRRGDQQDVDPRPVVKLLWWLTLGCLLIAVFLGLSKRGEPLWTAARAFFVPAGLLMVLQSVLLDDRRAHPIIRIAPNRALAPGLFTCGLGVAALGLEHLDPPRAWSLLAVPMIVFLGLLFLREAYRGKLSMLLRETSGRVERFWARLGMWMFGLSWPVFVLWAIGIVDITD
jgi:hypothetical protein